MKILHLIYTNGVAGAEKYLQHLLPSLREKAVDCHLIVVCSPGFKPVLENYCLALRASDTPVTLLVTTKIGFLKTAFSISRYLKLHKIKVVHSHLLNSDVLATAVKLFFLQKLIIISTKHGYNEQVLKKLAYTVDAAILKQTAQKDIHYFVTKFVIEKADFNYAVSKAAALLYYNMGLIKEVMPFIHHGVTVNAIYPSNKNEYRIAEKQLITVGRLEEIKGQRYLLEAIPLVIKKYPELKLIIIGDGTEKSNLQQLASSLQIENNVIFMGFNNNPYPYVSNSDVIILPSMMETFGLVYIEAFALGTPVIAFDTASSTEIIENNVTGLLVKPKDSFALAEKILFLLNNSSAAFTIAEAARQRYLTNFTSERMVNETEVYYQKIFKEISEV